MLNIKKEVYTKVKKNHKIANFFFVLLSLDLRGGYIQRAMGINTYVQYALFYVEQCMINKDPL